MPAQFKARPCRNGACPHHIVALTTNSDSPDWNGVSSFREILVIATHCTGRTKRDLNSRHKDPMNPSRNVLTS